MSPAFLRAYRVASIRCRMVKAHRAGDRLAWALYRAGHAFGAHSSGTREHRTYGRIDRKRRALTYHAAELSIELSALG